MSVTSEEMCRMTLAALESAGEGIVITTKDEAILFVNAAMERLTGWQQPEVLGHTPGVWRGTTAAGVMADMKRAIVAGETWRGEIINRRKDGALFDCAATIAPVRDSGGSIVGYIGVQRDITREKALDRLKEQFVADVSHELRAPATNRRLYAQLLKRGKAEWHEHYVNVIESQAERLAAMVEGILDLTWLERGHASLRPLDLNRVVGPVVESHLPRAEAAGLSLVFEAAEGLPLVRGDVEQLARVATNLLVNALNYTREGGVTLRTYAADGRVYLDVRDTGAGIEPDDMPYLFDRFYRSKRTKRDVPGTGLGLAIVKDILDRHSGHIAVESEPGRGSLFRVSLPEALDG